MKRSGTGRRSTGTVRGDFKGESHGKKRIDWSALYAIKVRVSD